MPPQFNTGKSVEHFGYTVDSLARMARVGFLFEGIETSAADGTVADVISFSFVPDSPMGRINRAAGLDNLDLLDRAVEDARHLDPETFASKYASFGPYENQA